MNRTPIAFLNLISNPTRAIISLSGVAFALLLIFVQLGFRGAVANTATIVYGKLDFDILIQSTGYLHLYEPRTFDRRYMEMIRSRTDLVQSVEPFWIMINKWRSPQDGRYRAIGMMAVESGSNPILVPELDEKLKLLASPDFVLMDRATRPDYGPKDGKRFGDEDIGEACELGERQATIVGHFLIGTGLATNGAVLISDVGYGFRSNVDVKSQVSMGLVRLNDGVDPAQAVDELQAWLQKHDPSASFNMRLLTRKQTIANEHHRWLNETPIGVIFQMGVVLAFMVGAAVVYMVLAQDVMNRLPEYATLKAMGYSQGFVSYIVLQQALWLAIAGFIPAVLLSEVLYRITAWSAGIPIGMTVTRLVGVALLSIAMCTLSGMGALRKLWQADPASLF
ncbi:MAG: FtsX-like permease family protein [Pirellulales bacterium]